MREALYGWSSRWHRTLKLVFLASSLAAPIGRPATAAQKYGPLELSGSVDTQNLVRHSKIDKYQFIQNRNTARIRVDYDWLQNGKLIDRFEVPFLDRSKLFILYRGVYDGFYDIAPTDLQHGETRFDDLVGGPIAGNDIGQCQGGPCTEASRLAIPTRPLQRGVYSRYNAQTRSGIKFENTLREAYVDLKVKGAPLSFRLGRQQVIWGESDQFRLMDIWNPLDLTWHLQQESGSGAGGGGGSWDNIRIPLWLGKGLWDIGEVGPLSNAFLEVVYNPFDFQPNQKLSFLPRPWAAFIPDPLRDGQVQQVLGDYFATRFNLQGTNFRHGDFERNPQDASEVGTRFHAVTPQGLEFTTNYLYARGRGVGAMSPLGVQIDKVSLTSDPAGDFVLDNGASVVKTKFVDVTAKIKYPYNHIFGLTGNYFEGDYTAAVFRLETAYVLGEPVQTIEASKLILPKPNPRLDQDAPLQMDKRDVWAGMIGFDRPTWIRFLNPKATWFLSMQFFWNYIDGKVDVLRGNSGAGETPYFTPSGGVGSKSGGVGQFVSGQFAGITERLQQAKTDPSGDNIRRWEHLITFAGTTFYRGGTVVPFVATAWDPVNDNAEFLWNLDYFLTNNLIVTPFQKFFTTYGSKAPSNDPWGAAGRNARRDETGVKVTYQF